VITAAKRGIGNRLLEQGRWKRGQKPKSHCSSHYEKKSHNENMQTTNDLSRDDEHAFITINFTLIASGIKESGHILNTGTTSHFDLVHENFTNLQPIPPHPIKAADGHTFHEM
jgi:hypothetical protein